jgi:hypothetical protein
MRLSTIICEGPHDQAFWEGWLDRFSIRPLPPKEREIFQESVNATGYASTNREHALQTGNGNFVGVRPVGSESKILPTLRSILRDRPKYEVSQIVINLDPDTISGDGQTGLRVTDVLREVRKIDSSATEEDNSIGAFDGAVRIFLVRWEVAGETPLGVPEKQTLERLVCSATQKAYPERAEDVAKWLSERRNASATKPKAFVWSFMAGWHADSGCTDFFKDIWRDPKIAEELKVILQENGTWRVAESLAQGVG